MRVKSKRDMEESIVLFETAKLAKEKGFKWKTLDSFYKMTFEEIWKSNSREKHGEFIDWNTETISVPKNNISRPTQSLLQKWLREVHKSDITVITDWKKGVRVYYVGLSFINKTNEIDIWFSIADDKNKIEYKHYEQALEIGLQEALKLIETTTP